MPWLGLTPHRAPCNVRRVGGGLAVISGTWRHTIMTASAPRPASSSPPPCRCSSGSVPRHGRTAPRRLSSVAGDHPPGADDGPVRGEARRELDRLPAIGRRARASVTSAVHTASTAVASHWRRLKANGKRWPRRALSRIIPNHSADGNRRIRCASVARMTVVAGDWPCRTGASVRSWIGSAVGQPSSVTHALRAVSHRRRGRLARW